MLRFLSVVFFGLMALGCGSSESQLGEKPANLVPEETMVKILAQVHLNEARISKYSLGSTDSASILFNRLQAKTLKQYGVDTSAYTKSYIYYSARPADLARIYERVVEQLKEVQKAKEKVVSKKPIS
ncbi:DUF4296 domain-containing protein [Fibrella sp. WM1]|uniref:DUF4296 domain-containing protein n=1 Tax=Fibrella musci TaxID=3242485 RepID=UPI0035223F5B